MCDGISAIAAASAVLAAGTTAYAAEQSSSASRDAMNEGRKTAEKQAADAEALLAQQSKKPRRASAADLLYPANSGTAATALTGASGAATAPSTLSKPTLLGA